jgi:hypothetical protein
MIERVLHGSMLEKNTRKFNGEKQTVKKKKINLRDQCPEGKCAR